MLETDIYGTWEINGTSRHLISPSDLWYEENYTLQLTSDKQSILADGIDTATLTAKLYKSTGETVSFYDEQGTLLDAVVESNGQAQLKVSSKMSGKIVIKAVSVNYGEAIIEIEVV